MTTAGTSDFVLLLQRDFRRAFAADVCDLGTSRRVVASVASARAS